MAETFSAEEREAMVGLSRKAWRQAPASLRVNCETGEAISPAGVFSDEDVARLEGVHRSALERYPS